MDFKTFQSNCKYAQYGLKQDTVRDFELTCRRRDCIPSGHSWGVCDEAHCPHFGVKISSGTTINQETGRVLHTFDGGKFSLGDGRIVFDNKMDKYNEYQEALDYVNKLVNRALACLNIKPESELPKSLHKLQELVNKETPKKVPLPIGTFNFHCPSCGGYSATFQGQHYCLYCGQKLDWSEKRWLK